ncbi:DUF5681 domain-containing protein [Mesorhizobium escarrei]|uniref:DUF5681 domain-containing protein n=1 Tax=Mesorhizobium escarrei TaxID=666018 RepID=A0ABN8JEE3_9HYPH|nr:DUF5681 domain-containing protein [Mesorhizobium escarrei]CAH2396488.1 hypothetical protein MES5069_1360009 [Mesorhizobium escarrei]
MSDDSDDKVGYGRPPKKTRFKPGQSGNPGGRKKLPRNVATALVAELQCKVTVRENGRDWKLPKSAALAKALVARALKGDAKAFGHIMALLPDHFRVPEGAMAEAGISDIERAVLERFINRKIYERGGQPAPLSIQENGEKDKDNDWVN